MLREKGKVAKAVDKLKGLWKNAFSTSAPFRTIAPKRLRLKAFGVSLRLNAQMRNLAVAYRLRRSLARKRGAFWRFCIIFDLLLVDNSCYGGIDD